MNIEPINDPHSNFKYVVGDARKIDQFQYKEFDLVFSNSVIEHVGNYNDQEPKSDYIKYATCKVIIV